MARIRPAWSKLGVLGLVLGICAVMPGQSGRNLVDPGVVLAQSGCITTEAPSVPGTVSLSVNFADRVIYKVPVKEVAGVLTTFAMTSSTPGGPQPSNLDTQTGTVRFQPFQLGKFDFVITSSNCSGKSATTTVTMEVNPNPAQPVILDPVYSTRIGLVMEEMIKEGDDDPIFSKIREGATLVVVPPGGTFQNGESFKLELRRPKGNPPRTTKWQVRLRDNVKSTPGGLTIDKAIRQNDTFSIVVVSDGIPSVPVPSSEITFKNP
jgi:hypothetical protein